MKKSILLILLFLVTTLTFAQSIIGKWKTIDEDTGEAKSIIEIYKKNDGKVYGKVVEILREANKNNLCGKCEGADYNKPIQGLEIIKSMKKEGDFYEGGTIFDPESGKIYKLRLGFDDDEPGKLQVRGYLAFFYRTQYWEPVK